jgi:hypothetical protein
MVPDGSVPGVGVISNAIKPSRWYFALAAAVIVGGAGLFAWVIWKGVSSIPSKVQQVVAPGETDLTLPAPGNYTIYYELRSTIGNQVYSTGDDVPGLECSVTAKESGKAVALTRSTVASTYSFGGRAGVSLFDFHIDQPGVYRIAATYPAGRQGSEVVLGIGHGVAATIVTTVVKSLGILFSSLAIGMTLIVVTAVKRHNAAKRLSTAGGPPPPIE